MNEEKRFCPFPFCYTQDTPPYMDTSLPLCLLSEFQEFSLASEQTNPPQFITITVYAQKEIHFMQVFVSK